MIKISIEEKDFIYEFWDDKTPTLIVIQKTKTIFEKDSILIVYTNKDAIRNFKEIINNYNKRSNNIKISI